MRYVLAAVVIASVSLVGTGCMVGVAEPPPGVAEDPSEDGATDAEDRPIGDDSSGTTSTLALTLTDGLDAEERVFLQKINDYRASLGVAPLQVSVALTRACDVHAQDMATNNYFAHDSQDGTSWSERVRRYYDHNTYLAENIAAGNAGGDATFTQWKNSPGHDANMKSASYRVIGISRVYNASATYRWYWVTDFGGYVDEVMTGGDTTTPPPPPPVITNLLVNGGFESSELTAGVVYTSVKTTGRWYWYSQQGNATRTTQAASTGTTGLRVVDALTGYISIAQLVAASAGKTYTLTAKTRRSGGSTSQVVFIDFLDASFAHIGRSTVSAGSGTTFHTITRSVVAPSGTAYARVTLYGYQSNNDYASTYDWDDVTLTAN